MTDTYCDFCEGPCVLWKPKTESTPTQTISPEGIESKETLGDL